MEVAPISCEQFRFRAGIGTKLFRLTNTIRDELNNRETTWAVFLHLAKAFDTQWHEDLVFKLRIFEYSGAIINLIASYLKERELRIIMGLARSSNCPILDSIPGVITLIRNVYHVHSRHTKHDGARADDIALYPTRTHESLVCVI